VRERINTPDDDFLDLDWIRQGSPRLAVVTHGFEGSSDRGYIAGTAKILAANGWDVLAWNCRSCSGEMNRQYRFYHAGDTGDIHTVVTHALAQKHYPTVALIGYSLGGSQTFRYATDFPEPLAPSIKTVVAISTPVDIEESMHLLERRSNRMYRKLFLQRLRDKLTEKAKTYPDRVDLERLQAIQTFTEFNEYISAPMYGYGSLADYYAGESVLPHLPKLSMPGLLLNAANDPILGPKCYPSGLAQDHPYFHLEICRNGGHTGFWRPGEEYTFADKRIINWLNEQL